MADLIIVAKKQSIAEVRQWDFDFTLDLQEGVSIVSATAVHQPPGGLEVDTTDPVVGTPVNGIVPVQFGPLTIIGNHYLSCLAVLDNGEKTELKAKIKVEF